MRTLNHLLSGTELKEMGAKVEGSTNMQVLVERKNNDINGNPKYHVTLFFEGRQTFLKLKGQRNTKDNRYILQSYDIESDVVRLMNNISESPNYLDFTENI